MGGGGGKNGLWFGISQVYTTHNGFLPPSVKPYSYNGFSFSLTLADKNSITNIFEVIKILSIGTPESSIPLRTAENRAANSKLFRSSMRFYYH